MSYIITSLYPAEKAAEVSKKYLEALAKYPPDDSIGTLIVPVAVKPTLEGIKVIAIWEAKKGRLEDALTLARQVMFMFMSIPGYRYTIDTYATAEEAMKLQG